MCECYRWRRDYIDSCGSVRDVCVNVTGGGGVILTAVGL